MNNTETIILIDRESVDQAITQRMGLAVSVTDEQWGNIVDAIHGNTELWDFVDNAIQDGIEELADGLVSKMDQ